jgi:hypothetical protein
VVLSQLGYSLRPPGTEYYIIVVAGLAASLAIIASTLPLLNRITGPRNRPQRVTGSRAWQPVSDPAPKAPAILE